MDHYTWQLPGFLKGDKIGLPPLGKPRSLLERANVAHLKLVVNVNAMVLLVAAELVKGARVVKPVIATPPSVPPRLQGNRSANVARPRESEFFLFPNWPVWAVLREKDR